MIIEVILKAVSSILTHLLNKSVLLLNNPQIYITLKADFNTYVRNNHLIEVDFLKTESIF